MFIHTHTPFPPPLSCRPSSRPHWRFSSPHSPHTLSPPVLQTIIASLESNLQEASAKVQKLTLSASGSQQAAEQLARERERISRQLALAVEREGEMGKALTAAQVRMWGGGKA